MLNLKSLTSQNPLIIMDLANNHNGSLSHGKKIIDDVTKAFQGCNFKIAVKFQYRNLPNFIHEDFQSRRDIKYVDRFLSSKLEWADYAEMKKYVRDLGMLAACTPFDEYSVDKVIEHEFDILKIASVSFTDWPLLEKIASSWSGPIIASTAGATDDEIKRVVNFFENRNLNYAIMHCVAAYPTPDSELRLGRIRDLKKSYPYLPVGYSTHEKPDNYLAAPVALAEGAVILERHVGSTENGQAVNAYSSEYSHLVNWIANLKDAINLMGSEENAAQMNPQEQNALRGLRRYVFANAPIASGQQIDSENVFYAIPGTDEQISANEMGKYINLVSKVAIVAGDPVLRSNCEIIDSQALVFDYKKQIMTVLENSRITLPSDLLLELSHHYGLESFSDFGCSMITVVNRDYCKKIIVLLPGQTHPPMFHKQKDETFFLAYGDVALTLDDRHIDFKVGNLENIPKGMVHGMSSKNGAVIEEISSSHILSDSFYLDENITKNTKRKTFIKL